MIIITVLTYTQKIIKIQTLFSDLSKENHEETMESNDGCAGGWPVAGGVFVGVR